MPGRRIGLPIIGGGAGIGRDAVPSAQSLSPSSSPSRRADPATPAGIPTLEPSSYIASSEAQSRMTRMGSLYSIDPSGRTAFRRRLLDRFSGDSVNVAQTKIENGAFVPITQNGINNFRPEIIATMDFMPIWQPNALSFADGRLKNASPIGELLSFQYQTKQLRQETLQALIANIKNKVNSDPFSLVENEFSAELTRIQSAISLLNSVIQNIYTINDSLDIKNIPSNNYIIRENYVDVAIPSLRQFALSKMQYSNTQYDNFSETKILLQLLFDFQNVLTNYSYNLLDFIDNDRVIDRSVSAVDKSFSLSDGFTFSISNYRSTTVPINATSIYDSFNQSLPEEPDSVLKLLIYLLAKEFIVSTGLGNSQNQDIITKYGAQNTIATVANIPFSNIFNNIVGNVGDTIFELPTGLPNSIASLFYINSALGPNNIILPFENRYITADDGKTYIPGNSYFSDAIISTDTTAWNVKPYTDYVGRFESIYIDAKSAIERLFNFRYIKRKGVQEPTGLDAAFNAYSRTVVNLLSPTDLYQKIIEAFQSSFDRLNTRETTILGNYNQSQRDIESLQKRIEVLNKQRTRIKRSIEALYRKKEVWDRTGGAFDPIAAAIDEIEAVIGWPSSIETPADLERNIGEQKQFLEQIEADIEAKKESLKIKEERMLDAKISADQSFVMALYNYAANDIILKKHLYNITILAGVWANQTTNSEFINRLTLNELKTFSDLVSQDRVNIVLNIGTPSERPAGIAWNLSNVLLNKNDPLFNRGPLITSIDWYVDQVVVPYMKQILTTINVRSVRSEPLTNLLSAIVPAINIDNLGDVFKKIIKGDFQSNILVQKSLEMMNTLFDSTKQSNQIVHVFDNGRTKYNGLSLSTQFMFLHEIFVNLAKKYSSIKIKKIINIDRPKETVTARPPPTLDLIGDVSEFFGEPVEEPPTAGSLPTITDYYVGIEIPVDTQLTLQNAFDLIKTGDPPSPGNVAEPSQNTATYSDLYDIYNKLNLEFNYIRDVLGILDVIKKRLVNTSDNVSTFFRQNALATFLSQSPITNLDLIKYVSQLRLANLIYNDLKERVTYSDSLITLPGGPGANVSFESSTTIVSDAIIPSEYNALVSMLSENNSTFQTVSSIDLSNEAIERNNKIITIGIPAGFSKQLSDRVSVTQFNRQGAEGKQADIIAINLFPNDMRFGEIVLKPITYIVDLSLFTTKKDFYDLNANVGEGFSSQLIPRMKVSDLENPNDIKKIGIVDILSDIRYSFLTTEQKENLFRTLIQSHLFGLYVNSLTGIRYNEDVFTATNEPRTIHPALINSIKRYLTSELQDGPTNYTTTEEILNNPSYSEKVKDTYRLMTYGNLVFNRNEATRRVNNPKIFDRIYHLPIYLGAAEIDIVATTQTESGRLALAKPAVQKYIVSTSTSGPLGPLYLVSNEPDDFIIKDVFFAALTNDTGTGVGLDWDRITVNPEEVGNTANVESVVTIDTGRRVLGLRRT